MIVTEYVSNSTFIMTKNMKKKMLPVSAPLLCYPTNEEEPQLKKHFLDRAQQ
jgi:hypothetical protein